MKAVVESSDATIASLTNADDALKNVTNWTIGADTITLYYAFSMKLCLLASLLTSLFPLTMMPHPLRLL